MTPSRRTRLTAALAVFLPLMILYAITACRTVGPGDSGELTAVMTSWGVAHAPGYPLLSLLGNIVSRLPFPGEPAFLLNLMTSFFAALAGAVLALAVIEVSGNLVAGILAGVALGTARAFWEYALVVEVFSLNSLAGALLLYALARLLRGLREKKPALWPLPVMAGAASTAVTHHLTLSLLAIPVLGVTALVLFAERRRFSAAGLRKSLILSAAVGLAGLLPLLYIPIAARGNPTLNWDDPSTTTNLIRLLKREDFGSGTLMSPWMVASTILDKGESASPLGARQFKIFWSEIPRNFGWIFPLLAVIGVLSAAMKSRWLALLLAGFAGMLTVFFLRVNSPVVPIFQGITERFYILPSVVIAFCGGLGIAHVANLLDAKDRRIRVAFLGVLAFATISWAWVTAPNVNMADNTFTRDFGANLLEDIPPNAILLSEGDLFHNAFYYQQVSLGKRPDIEFIDQQKLTYPWYVNQVRRRGRFRLPAGMTAYSADTLSHTKAWLDLNRDRPIVAVSVRDQSWADGWFMIPMGLVWKFVPRPGPVDVVAETAAFEAAVRRWNLKSAERHYHERSWETAQAPFYPRALGLLAGMKDLAEDVTTGKADVAPDAGAQEWLTRGIAISHGDSSAVRAAHLEVYQRVLLEQWIDFSAFGDPGPVIHKALSLCKRAVNIDPGNVAAFRIWVSLVATDPATYTPKLELDLRGQVVDLAPGNADELTAYMQLAINMLNNPEQKGLVSRDDMIRRQEAFLKLLDVAVQVSDEPSLKNEKTQWEGYLARTRSLPP